MELDLIGQCAPWPLGKRAISDVPQATKSVQFEKIAGFSIGVKFNVWQLNKYMISYKIL